MTSQTPELLMPAGDPEKLRYAFAYGADAVYAGVPVFSLRARENGFKPDTLKEAIDYTHRLGKKIYLTMNSFIHNGRVDAFLNSFCEMADLNPDGFIMAGIGPIVQCLKLRPSSVIHLSTQANATNWTDVQFFRDLGVKRVILSRELSIKEIAEIHQRVPDIELEAFVHGAICIAYSGRCLISNYLANRDANTGTCTNSCRWNYKLGIERNSLSKIEGEFTASDQNYQPLPDQYYVIESERPNQRFEIDEDEHGTYLMNSKDLCAIELLKEIRDAGVVSFKVEGRSKGIYYVATVANAYRRAIDDMVANRPFNPENLRQVASTSNRTLMTGFYLRKPKDYGQNYDDGQSMPLTHRYAGQVVDLDCDSKQATVLFKNDVARGDTIEWITPSSIEAQEVSKIFSPAGEPLERIHGGYLGIIDCPTHVTKESLIRTPII